MEIAAWIQAQNQSYVAQGKWKALPSAEPARKLAVVTCMDARIDVLGALGLELGDAHVLRNAGGIVTEDVVRSLIVSQRLLGTDTVILVHHTGCGMATVGDEELRSSIEEETGIRPPFTFDPFRDPVQDVRQSLRRLRACPFLPYKERLYGFVLDIATGRLNPVGEA